jgi:hypothetical protein
VGKWWKTLGRFHYQGEKRLEVCSENKARRTARYDLVVDAEENIAQPLAQFF